MKRDRDDFTESIIQEALSEFQEDKQSRKSNATQNIKTLRKEKAAVKGDIETGPVKESLVGIASVKRAVSRKGHGIQDEDDNNLEVFEEELELAEEEGVQFEAFNLKEEREKGYFDEEGNYVENRQNDEEKDAWLDSDEAKVLDAETARWLAEKQAEEEKTSTAPLTGKQIDGIKAEMIKYMQEGETVLHTLQRLGSSSANSRKVLGKREKAKLQSLSSTVPSKASDEAAFAKLTEMADRLLNEGEFEIYSSTREVLEKEAHLFLPKVETSVQGTSLPTLPNIGEVKVPGAEEPQDDMFADEDTNLEQSTNPSNKGGLENLTPSQSQDICENGTQVVANGGTIGEKGLEKNNFNSWPVSKLKQLLSFMAVDTSSMIEKHELVTAIKSAAQSADFISFLNFMAPAGYTYDSSTGYFYDSSTSLYFDVCTDGYYNPADSQWYYFSEETQSLAPWIGK